MLFTVDFDCSSSRQEAENQSRKRCQALRRPGERISCSPRQWQHWTHARPPRSDFDARFIVSPFTVRRCIDLPRAWCARSVSSFCVALFCKAYGNTRTVLQKKMSRPSEYLRFTIEMAESTEYETCRRHWWGLRTTDAFSLGSRFVLPDWFLWLDLATTQPILSFPTIVYTLLIGSLFLRERDEDVHHRCNDARDARVAFARYVFIPCSYKIIVILWASLLSTIGKITPSYIHCRRTE